MHRVQTTEPRPELREFVRAFGAREMDLAGTRHQQSNVACLEHIIAFDFGTRPSVVFGEGELKLIPRVHLCRSADQPRRFLELHRRRRRIPYLPQAPGSVAIIWHSVACVGQSGFRRRRRPGKERGWGVAAIG